MQVYKYGFDEPVMSIASDFHVLGALGSGVVYVVDLEFWRSAAVPNQGCWRPRTLGGWRADAFKSMWIWSTRGPGI